MNTEKTKNLLTQVGDLLKSYEKLAKSTGENFNIFSIIKMESKEVGTHSAFLGELLNPKGTHSFNDTFLTIFIDLLERKFNKIEVIPDELPQGESFDSKNIVAKTTQEGKFKLDLASAFTTIEKYAGIINQGKTEGGRIDIIVEDKKGRAIIIENKIYAIEQTNQLIRYNNYNGEAPILYLTLYGDKPNSAEGLTENDQYFCISYKEDIVKWLELCQKEAADKPMLREVLKQYIYLIKKLTHQTINNELKMDISDLIRNNFLEASQIANNFEKVKTQIITEFWEKVEVLCKKNLGNEWHIENKPDLINRFNHILFHQSGNDSAFFYFRYNKNNGEVIYGILLNSEMQNQIKCKDIFDNLDKTLILSRYNYGDQSIIWFKDQNFNFSDVDLLAKINHKKDELAVEFAVKITSFIETNKELYAKILEYINQKKQ